MVAMNPRRGSSPEGDRDEKPMATAASGTVHRKVPLTVVVALATSTGSRGSRFTGDV
jgi:hypothetical protein